MNTKVECLRLLKDYLISKSESLGVPKESVDPLVDELDNILNMIPYVRSGDIIQPEHHNYIVDALRKARDIVDIIERVVGEYAKLAVPSWFEVNYMFSIEYTIMKPLSTPYVTPLAPAGTYSDVITYCGVTTELEIIYLPG